jgi:hypothetical protein
MSIEKCISLQKEQLNAAASSASTLPFGMWEIYRIGLSLGLGIAIGLLLCGLLAPRRALVFAVAAVAAAAGFGVGWAIGGWQEAIAGAAGGGLATLVAGPVTARTLEGGGTRSGTAVLFFASALVFAGVAFVPFLGYLEVAAVQALAARARRRRPDRYAGLRTLARD